MWAEHALKVGKLDLFDANRNPQISVIIPTLNRAEVLAQTLESLLQQSLSSERFEIVVVDDGSEDETARVVEGFCRADGPQIRYYFQDHQFKGAASNRGVQESRAPLILMLDSDIVASSGLVEKHLHLHHRHLELEFVVLGGVATRASDVDLLNPAASVTGDERWGPAEWLTTANLSVKRTFLEQAGPFTTGLPCLEDTDMAFRLADRGMRLLYCPSAYGFHLVPLETVDQVVVSGQRYGSTLAEWLDQLPHLKGNMRYLGAGFSGGWSHLRSSPRNFVKNAVRRLLINRYTIDVVYRIARSLERRRSPSRSLFRCCSELWSFHYRSAFWQSRKNVANRD